MTFIHYPIITHCCSESQRKSNGDCVFLAITASESWLSSQLLTACICFISHMYFLDLYESLWNTLMQEKSEWRFCLFYFFHNERNVRESRYNVCESTLCEWITCCSYLSADLYPKCTDDAKKEAGWSWINIQCRKSDSQLEVKREEEDHLTLHVSFTAAQKRISDLDYLQMESSTAQQAATPSRVLPATMACHSKSEAQIWIRGRDLRHQRGKWM